MSDIGHPGCSLLYNRLLILAGCAISNKATTGEETAAFAVGLAGDFNGRFGISWMVGGPGVG